MPLYTGGGLVGPLFTGGFLIGEAWMLIGGVPTRVYSRPHDAVTVSWDSAGSHTVTVPSWARSADVVVLGAGGGGAAYDDDRVGVDHSNQGGRAGHWSTSHRSVTPGDSLSVTVGKGGREGEYHAFGTVRDAEDGGASGVDNTTAAGGAGGAWSVLIGNEDPQAPGSRSQNGTTYHGGTAGGSNHPAGGAGAGGMFQRVSVQVAAGPGGDGKVWIVFYDWKGIP